MDDLSKTVRDFINDPLNQLVLFVAFFLSRIILDKWDRRRNDREKRRRKGGAHG